MLFGEYHHSIDNKNRFSVPAKLRDALGTEFIIFPSLRGECLRFYSLEKFDEYLKPLRELPHEKTDVGYWYLHRMACQVEPDSLGRVLLTPQLIACLGFDPEEEGTRNIVLVGCGDYGEIWAEEKYSSMVADADFEEIRRSLKQKGL